MTGSVKLITEDSQFDPELTSAAAKLTIVDFYAEWCGPCRRFAPEFERLALKYPEVNFLQVDVDKCQETAQAHEITAMPTFVFFRNKASVDQQRGGDPAALEEKIKENIDKKAELEGRPDDVPEVKGHIDLVEMITKKGCECLNEADEHTHINALTSRGGFLESDCDEQLIVAIEFQQAVKLHSLRINGPADKGPKTLKLFLNQPRTLDFDSAENMAAVQEIVLNPEDLETSALIPLKYVKFQNVQTITIFIKDNQEGGEVTQVDYIGFIGSPINVTNMNEFKRVAGKKGESE